MKRPKQDTIHAEFLRQDGQDSQDVSIIATYRDLMMLSDDALHEDQQFIKAKHTHERSTVRVCSMDGSNP